MTKLMDLPKRPTNGSCQHGDLVDERTRERMQRFLEALVAWTERFKITITTYERSK